MEPKIVAQRRVGEIAAQSSNDDSFDISRCKKCGKNLPSSSFIAVKHFLFPNGHIDICNDCLRAHFIEAEWNWEEVDRFCRSIDIPFIPREFERQHAALGDDVLPAYAKYFKGSEYEGLGWRDYFNEYVELREKGRLDEELPTISDSYYQDLALRWGLNYDHEQLVYLENLYKGLLATQNVNGALQTDQAQKLCKISLQIDERIRADADFDKLMGTYEKMTKVADFTPKNAKTDADFSSFGEVAAWLEKRGWINKYYDDANKDIVDEVIHSNQAFIQRLYTNETGIGDEITERIEQIKLAATLDSKDNDLERKRFENDPFFDLSEVKQEEHDNEAYEELFVDDALSSDTVGV